MGDFIPRSEGKAFQLKGNSIKKLDHAITAYGCEQSFLREKLSYFVTRSGDFITQLPEIFHLDDFITQPGAKRPSFAKLAQLAVRLFCKQKVSSSNLEFGCL